MNLLDEFKIAEDWRSDRHGDPYGSAMSVLFDIAAELNIRDEVPASWLYRPSPMGDDREPDSYWYDLTCNAGTQELIDFGNILSRYIDKLKVAEMDY